MHIIGEDVTSGLNAQCLCNNGAGLYIVGVLTNMVMIDQMQIKIAYNFQCKYFSLILHKPATIVSGYATLVMHINDIPAPTIVRKIFKSKTRDGKYNGFYYSCTYVCKVYIWLCTNTLEITKRHLIVSRNI